MTSPALPRFRALRLFSSPTLLVVPRMRRFAAAGAIGVLALGGSVTITVNVANEQAAHTVTVTDLDSTISGLGSAVEVAGSAVKAVKDKLAEYGALLLEQDAAFENTDGFLK